jgi:ubiquinone/menaquinone biosynthesis C-methylase UbiE
VTDYALRLSDDEMARYRLMAEQARAHESELWTQAGVGPGARIADVGCGPGAVLALLAEAVGSEGHVVGLDSDESAVAAASALIESSGLTNASVRPGKADDTGLPEAGFDVVMMRHVLAHNGGAEQRIVDHLATLVRPGGALYLLDVHLKAVAIYPEPAGLQDLFERYLAFLVGRGSDVRIGLRLSHLVKTAGLLVEDFRGWIPIIEARLRGPAWAARDAMLADGVIDEDDVDRWDEAFKALDAADERPLLFPSVFAAIGRRPADPP